jgi:hypothetical protein
MLHRCLPLVLIAVAPAFLPALAGQTSQPAVPSLAPRTVTLKGQGILLSQALAELTKQAGIAVHDRRKPSTDPKLTLNLDRAPFWQAVDTVATQAGAAVSLYQPDGSIALTAGPARPAGASYSGIFRSALKRLVLTRDLETGAHGCALHLEIAWDPWYRPFLLEIKSYDAEFAPDATGKALRVHRKGTGQQDVHGRLAVEVDPPLRLPAPDRSSRALASLKGTFSVIGPTKMLTVRFDDLGKAAKDGKPRRQTPEEGITVTLSKLTVVDADRWEVEMSLAYPPGGPKFESFQSWLVNNQIYLESGSGSKKVRLRPRPADERVITLSASRAVIQYYFVEGSKGPRLGSPGNWSLVYETPGRILEVTAPFELKDLPLP